MQKTELSKSSKEAELFYSSLGDMVKVFSAVASEDSMKIFYLARDGIESSTKAIQELELTQKRYYTRLKELLESGLLQKEENAYTYTALGKICYKLGMLFMETLNYSEQLEMIDKVRKSSSMESAEKDKIISALSKDALSNLFSMTNVLDTEDLLSVRKVLKVVDSYEGLVKTVTECFDRAEEQIRIASRYTPTAVAEKVQDAIVRGIKLDWIDGDKTNLSNKLGIMKLVFMNPKAVINFYQAVNDPNSDLRFYSNLSYCFMIMDRKFGAIEIPDPITGEFLFAIFFEDPVLSEKLSQEFDKLKEKAVEHPYKELARKFRKIKL